jgi:hypothetical protein
VGNFGLTSASLASFGLLVDDCLGNFRENRIGVLLFLQCLIQKLRRLAETQLTRQVLSVP